MRQCAQRGRGRIAQVDERIDAGAGTHDGDGGEGVVESGTAASQIQKIFEEFVRAPDSCALADLARREPHAAAVSNAAPTRKPEYGAAACLRA